MCHKIGRPPISIIGLGRVVVSSLILVPKPPARMTTFIYFSLFSELPTVVVFITLNIIFAQILAHLYLDDV